MVITRRKFLKAALLFSGVLSAGYFSVKQASSVRSLLIKFVSPDLKASSVGSVEQHVLDTLLAAVKNLTVFAIEKNHYEDFFRWRSEHLKGYKDVYEQLAEALDAVAKNQYNLKFIQCNSSQQRQVISKIRPNGRLDRLSMKLFHEKYLVAEQYFFKEVLLLFTLTDAWVVIGYNKWPGQPRGLVNYTKPVILPERS